MSRRTRTEVVRDHIADTRAHVAHLRELTKEHPERYPRGAHIWNLIRDHEESIEWLKKSLAEELGRH